MATRGPVPARSDQRRRTNKPDDGGPTEITSAPAAVVVEVPAADPAWHPVALAWFASLAKSGQSSFYEPSDWAVAVLIAESISRDLKPQFVGFQLTGIGQQEALYETIPLKGASLGAYLRAMSNLLATEGDRRRVRLELQRGAAVDEDEQASVASLDRYRAALKA